MVIVTVAMMAGTSMRMIETVTQPQKWPSLPSVTKPDSVDCTNAARTSQPLSASRVKSSRSV